MVRLSSESLRSVCEGAGWSISDEHWNKGWVHAIKVVLDMAKAHGDSVGLETGFAEGYTRGLEDGRCTCG